MDEKEAEKTCSLRNEKLKANRTSETEEQRKERLRIRREKDRAWRRTKGMKRLPDTDVYEKQRLATLKRLKRGEVDLRLEKVVASKQLRLAVETEEERRTRLEVFPKSWQLWYNIDTHNRKKYRSWFIVCFSHSSWYVPNNLYIII